MRIRIDAQKGVPLSLAPQTKEQEIIQNVLCIIHTVKGSVPCYRDFGLDNSFLHRPTPIAQSAFAAAIADAVRQYEPRATITRVDFNHDPFIPGAMYPVLEVTFLE